jgi:hypothetical protein
LEAWYDSETRDGSIRIIIKFDKRQFVFDMLERFNMVDCKPVGSPIAVDALSVCADGTSSLKLPLDGSVPYQSFIGRLVLHASLNTRPDITRVVNHMGRYMASPSQSHWEQAKRVLRYLKGTAESCLVYGGGVSSAELKDWSDLDYASDASERRSRMGYVFMLNGAAVSWKSRSHKTMALSTTEAEYMALTTAI